MVNVWLENLEEKQSRTSCGGEKVHYENWVWPGLAGKRSLKKAAPLKAAASASYFQKPTQNIPQKLWTLNYLTSAFSEKKTYLFCSTQFSNQTKETRELEPTRMLFELVIPSSFVSM